MEDKSQVAPTKFLRVETKTGKEAFFSLKDLAPDDEVIGFEVVEGSREESKSESAADAFAELAPEQVAVGTVIKTWTANGINFKRVVQEGGSTEDIRA